MVLEKRKHPDGKSECLSGYLNKYTTLAMIATNMLFVKERCYV